MDLIRCPRCAKEVPGSSQFCRRCGYTIAWNVAAAPPSAIPQFSPPISKPAPPQPRAARRTPAPTPSRPRKSGLLAVLAIFGAVYFFSHTALRTKPTSITPLPSFHFPDFRPPVFAEPVEVPATIYPGPARDSRFPPPIRYAPPVPYPTYDPRIIINGRPYPSDASSRSRNGYPNPHSNEQHPSERSSRQR